MDRLESILLELLIFALEICETQVILSQAEIHRDTWAQLFCKFSRIIMWLLYRQLLLQSRVEQIFFVVLFLHVLQIFVSGLSVV